MHSESIVSTDINSRPNFKENATQTVSQLSSQKTPQALFHIANNGDNYHSSEAQSAVSGCEGVTSQTTQTRSQSDSQGDKAGVPNTLENCLSLAAMSNSHSQSSSESQVLLATAVITLFSADKEPIQARVVFDSGSQTSFITERLVKLLKLPTYKFKINVMGINQNISRSTTTFCPDCLC